MLDNWKVTSLVCEQAHSFVTKFLRSGMELGPGVSFLKCCREDLLHQLVALLRDRNQCEI